MFHNESDERPEEFGTIHRVAKPPMRFKPPNCKRLQGAADARRRARRRTFVLQVSDNKADAVPCERLLSFNFFSH